MFDACLLKIIGWAISIEELFLENIPDVNAEEEMLRQDNDEMVMRLLKMPGRGSTGSDREDQGRPNSSGRREEGNRSS